MVRPRVDLAALVDEAVAAGLKVVLSEAGDVMSVDGPRRAEHLGRALIDQRLRLAQWIRSGPALDWSAASHYRAGQGGASGRCIHCGGFAMLVDEAGRPSHKVCAEAVIERQLAQLAPAQTTACA